MPEPIRPTRVIPAGQQLPPAPDPAPDGPPAEPTPPWWTTPGPPPGPLVVHVHHHVDQPPATPPARPWQGWDWSALWSWARWRHAAGAAAALAPIFGGWSLATGWGHALQDCRTQQSISGAWTLALLALTVACTAARWRPRWYTAALLTTAAFGLAAQASPFDLITFMTGVHQ